MRQRCSHCAASPRRRCARAPAARLARARRGWRARRWRSSRSACRPSASARTKRRWSWKRSARSSLGIMPPEKKCRLIQSDGAAIDERVGRRAVAEHVHEEAPAGLQPVVHAAEQRAASCACARTSPPTRRGRSRRRSVKLVHVGGDHLDVVEARGARPRARMQARCECELDTPMMRLRGIVLAPSTASASPSRSPVRAHRWPSASCARSQVAASARGFGLGRASACPRGHQALLYLRCGPSAMREEVRRHFVVLLVREVRHAARSRRRPSRATNASVSCAAASQSPARDLAQPLLAQAADARADRRRRGRGPARPSRWRAGWPGSWRAPRGASVAAMRRTPSSRSTPSGMAPAAAMARRCRTEVAPPTNTGTPARARASAGRARGGPARDPRKRR